MSDRGPRGGELARLDELESITREHARLGRQTLGIGTGVLVGVWIVAADRLLRLSVAAGLFAFALGVPAAAALLLFEHRRVLVRWAPADRFERIVVSARWRTPLLFGVWAFSAGSLLFAAAFDLPAEAMARAAFGTLVAALVAVLMASPWLLRCAEAAGAAVVPIQAAAISCATRAIPHASWLVPVTGATFVIGAAATAGWRAVVRRPLARRLALLEQTAILREHAE